MAINLTDTKPNFSNPKRIASRPIDIITLGSLTMEKIIQVEKWPETGGQYVVPVKSISDTSGGCAMSVACFAGRQGGKTAIISAIGDGIYSQIIWEELKASGVEKKYLKCHKDKEGNLIIILSNPEGDWTVLDYIDPDLSLGIQDLPSVDDFRTAKFLHIDGFSFLSLGKKEMVQEAVTRGHQAGCVLSVDASVPAAKNERDFLEALFRQADIGFANKYEGLQITQTTEIQAAIEKLQTTGPKVSVLKMGLEGSYVITRNAVGYVPAYEVDVLDTVAAGDSYIAAMLLSLCQELPLMEAATRGSAAGALACSGSGSLSSRFSDGDIDALIARGPKKK